MDTELPQPDSAGTTVLWHCADHPHQQTATHSRRAAALAAWRADRGALAGLDRHTLLNVVCDYRADKNANNPKSTSARKPSMVLRTQHCASHHAELAALSFELRMAAEGPEAKAVQQPMRMRGREYE